MPMAYYRETSTMVSDLVLSISAYGFGTYRMNNARWGSWREWAIGWFGLFGFSFIGWAAFLGFLRFGYFFPRRQYSLQGWHLYFSDLASIIGMFSLCISDFLEGS